MPNTTLKRISPHEVEYERETPFLVETVRIFFSDPTNPRLVASSVDPSGDIFPLSLSRTQIDLFFQQAEVELRKRDLL